MGTHRKREDGQITKARRKRKKGQQREEIKHDLDCALEHKASVSKSCPTSDLFLQDHGWKYPSSVSYRFLGLA